MGTRKKSREKARAGQETNALAWESSSERLFARLAADNAISVNVCRGARARAQKSARAPHTPAALPIASPNVVDCYARNHRAVAYVLMYLLAAPALLASLPRARALEPAPTSAGSISVQTKQGHFRGALLAANTSAGASVAGFLGECSIRAARERGTHCSARLPATSDKPS